MSRSRKIKSTQIGTLVTNNRLWYLHNEVREDPGLSGNHVLHAMNSKLAYCMLAVSPSLIPKLHRLELATLS